MLKPEGAGDVQFCSGSERVTPVKITGKNRRTAAGGMFTFVDFRRATFPAQAKGPVRIFAVHKKARW